MGRGPTRAAQNVLSAHESGWTQIPVLGQFRDPRYQESITKNMVESWQVNLRYSFGYACMLTLGRVPHPVTDALDSDTPRLIRTYKDAQLAAMREQDAPGD